MERSDNLTILLGCLLFFGGIAGCLGELTLDFRASEGGLIMGGILAGAGFALTIIGILNRLDRRGR